MQINYKRAPYVTFSGRVLAWWHIARSGRRVAPEEWQRVDGQHERVLWRLSDVGCIWAKRDSYWQMHWIQQWRRQGRPLQRPQLYYIYKKIFLRTSKYDISFCSFIDYLKFPCPPFKIIFIRIFSRFYIYLNYFLILYSRSLFWSDFSGGQSESAIQIWTISRFSREELRYIPNWMHWK